MTPSFEVLITPNPARDIVNIYTDNNKRNVSILILDASGRIVCKLDTDLPLVQINTSALGRGVYYVKVIDERNVSTNRLLLQ
jgi:hypothetical protein